MNFKIPSQKAFTLLAVILISLIAIILLTAIQRGISTTLRLRAVASQNSEQNIKASNGIRQTLAWMQKNSAFFAGNFTATNFSSNFTILSAPVIGENDTSNYAVTSAVRLLGSDTTPIISTNPELGLANFPIATKINSVETLDLNQDFQLSFPDADNNLAKIRITLLSVKSDGDFYSPIFRVESISNTPANPGQRLYALIEGSPIKQSPVNDDSGFFGSSNITLNGTNICHSVSYYHDSAWQRSAIHSNCLLRSEGTINLIGDKVRIYGLAKTNQEEGITPLSKISRKNIRGCAELGCHNTNLINVDNYSAACPSGGSTLNISSDTSLEAISGNNCWDEINIAANSTLKFITSGVPYLIRNLNLNSSSAKIRADIYSANITDKVMLQIEEFNGNQILASQILNAQNVPAQFQIAYTGTTPLLVTGNSSVYAHLYSPRTTLTLGGNIEFYGLINATALILNDSADLYSDESASVTLITNDMSFKLGKITQLID